MRRVLYASAHPTSAIRVFALAGILLAGLALVTGEPSQAEDEPARAAPAATTTRQVWQFRRGEDPKALRTVDVTDLDDAVREALLARMAADGYDRVAPSAPGRDLAADARALVAHGGRFPPTPSAGARGGPDAGDPSGIRTGPGAGLQGILLGAPVRLEARGETAWLRVLGAPDGSLARGLGLVRGDRILALDGRVPTFPLLARLRGVEQAPGQLALRLLRRRGRTEDWTLTFARGPAPVRR